MSRIGAILRQRCPRCLQGRVFRRFLDMNERCPDCDFRFGREEGYFTGAMYISYAIGLVLVFGIFGVLWAVWPSRTLTAAAVVLAITSPTYLVLVPAVYRYSRVVWLHLDYVISVRRHADEPD
ncbi:MAG: DUF983 domain-containing protein [Actinomycetota bacterium]